MTTFCNTVLNEAQRRASADCETVRSEDGKPINLDCNTIEEVEPPSKKKEWSAMKNLIFETDEKVLDYLQQHCK